MLLLPVLSPWSQSPTPCAELTAQLPQQSRKLLCFWRPSFRLHPVLALWRLSGWRGHRQEPGTGLLGKGLATYIDGIPLEYAQLQEELQLDLAFLEELFHLGLSLIQLLQHSLDVVDGAVVWGLVTGDGRVPVQV